MPRDAKLVSTLTDALVRLLEERYRLVQLSALPGNVREVPSAYGTGTTTPTWWNSVQSLLPGGLGPIQVADADQDLGVAVQRVRNAEGTIEPTADRETLLGDRHRLVTIAHEPQ